MLDSVKLQCPYCWQPIEVVIDVPAGDQEYIEDCFVCCRPITLSITIDEDNIPYVEARQENE